MPKDKLPIDPEIEDCEDNDEDLCELDDETDYYDFDSTDTFYGDDEDEEEDDDDAADDTDETDDDEDCDIGHGTGLSED